jgi:valyl-tRNA synthetase
MTTWISPDSIPNRFDFAEARHRIYQTWEERGYFHAEPDDSRPPFTIVIPPPNVTGALHLGHALNNTLQDICVRMKRMQGFNALWMPGTDHAGIATQAVVEKRLKEEEKKTRHDLGREQLVQRIWEWKEVYETRILGQLKEMGCSCDWQRLRFTLDDTCAKAVRSTFFDLFQKGLIYRGKRLVNWDTSLQTAVSDDEVVHETRKGHFWHFRYPVIDPQPGEPTHVEIATTRPETMLGDTAVAVHPDPARALDKVELALREKLATASDKEKEPLQTQLEALADRRQTMLPQLEQLRDMALAGRKLTLPLMNREIPLITDPWAKPELGSGCVKITPAHDPNDYEVWSRHEEIGAINILNPDGTLNENTGTYEGQSIHKARKQVVDDLDELELLGDVEDREIELGLSDRSKTPIEPYLADQWFVAMEQLSQTAMDAVTDGRVKIFPERYANGYLDWLSEKRDWPVSRQLWWGHQIPVWSKVIEDEGECEAFLASVAGQDGLDANANNGLVHVCLRDVDSPQAQSLEDAGFVREEDVLDTWFSSALWPHSTLGWPDENPDLAHFYPTSVLITSRDIITLWVARMVLMGLNNMGDVPFREVFIHPKILDGYGKTMSKSAGNGVDPLDVIEKFGPDALRYGLAYLTTDTQDVRMPVQFECPHCQTLINQTTKNRELPKINCDKCDGQFSTQWARTETDKALPRGAVISERFEQARNFCNKLWNASRFSLINLENYEAAEVADDQLAVEDRWLLSRLSTVTQQVTASLESYHFADAARALYDFAWDDFCSLYVEISKPRMQDELTRPIVQRVLAHALDTLLRLLHPMVPYITEEVWQLLGQVAPQRGLRDIETAAESIMIATWPVADQARQDVEIENRFAKFQATLGAIREIRSRQNIKNHEQIEFCVRCDEEIARLVRPMEPYLGSMAKATSTGWGPDVSPPATNAMINSGGMEIFVDLKDFIDVEAELARNVKEEKRLAGQIQGIEKKLGNANFVDRAPADVVQAERDKLTVLQDQLKGVEAALTNLRKQS